MIQVFLAAIAAYVLGCLVGAYYVVRLRTGRDVRETGSGNAGARNVLRTGNKIDAALTLGWDALKGALAVWLAGRIAPGEVAAGLAFTAAVVGHVWPAQLQFRGGKGVATAIGGLLAIGPRSLIGASWPLVAGVAAGCAIVLVLHHPSIDRRRRALSMRPAQESAS